MIEFIDVNYGWIPALVGALGVSLIFSGIVLGLCVRESIGITVAILGLGTLIVGMPASWTLLANGVVDEYVTSIEDEYGVQLTKIQLLKLANSGEYINFNYKEGVISEEPVSISVIGENKIQVTNIMLVGENDKLSLYQIGDGEKLVPLEAK